jgi:hypothetical protein
LGGAGERGSLALVAGGDESGELEVADAGTEVIARRGRVWSEKETWRGRVVADMVVVVVGSARERKNEAVDGL